MKDLFGTQELRALSWKQPFATLMLHGKIETRTWSTKHRGLVLICASLKCYSYPEILGISGENQYERIVDASGFKKGYKPNLWTNGSGKTLNGYAIAVGNLVDCRLMFKEDENDCFVEYKKPWKEIRDTKNGPVIVIKRLWCHIYKDVRPIKPFEFKGSQGWKKLYPEKHQDIINQIEFI